MSSSVFKVYATSSRDGFESDAGTSGGIGAKQNELDGSDAVPEDLKIDSNLVILVNKDGSVSVDQTTLQSLLANETNDTSVSVVRISSPTPSIEEEIEEERLLKEQKKQLDADAEAASSNEDSNEDSNSIAGTSSATSSIVGIATRRGRPPGKKNSVAMLLEEDDDPKHVSLTVEAYYSPREASNFAAQVLSLTGYEHPLRKEAVDIEFLKQIVSNDHCYTPLSSPTQKLPPRTLFDDVDSSEESTASLRSKSEVITAGTSGAKISDTRKPPGVKVVKAGPIVTSSATPLAQSKFRKSVTSPAVQQENKRTAKAGYPVGKPVPDDDDDEDDEDVFDSDYTDEESSYSEGDDEMDADFSVSGRTTNKKRKQTAKNKLSPKTPLRPQYKKLDMKDLTESSYKEGDKYRSGKMVGKASTPSGRLLLPQKATGKVEHTVKVFSAKKDVLQRSHTTSSSSSGSTTPTILNSKLPSTGQLAGKLHTKSDSSQPKQQPVANVVSTAPAIVLTSSSAAKKEKKVKSNNHDAALFSDMSALFSTPDIIKKVNANKAATPSIITSSTGVGTVAQVVTTTVRSAVAVKACVSSPTTSSGQRQLILSMPIPASTINPNAHSNTEQRLGLVDSIVPDNLHQPVSVPSISGTGSSTQLSAQLPQPPPVSEVSNVMNMLQTSSGSAAGPIMSALMPEVKSIPQVVTPVVGLLPDTSILDALNSNDDALPEELLEHVAELAKNKELQEILDKQVLGVISSEGLLASPVVPLGAGNAVANLLPEPPMILPITTNTTNPPTFPMIPLHNPTPDTSAEPVVEPQHAIKDQPVPPRKEAIQIRRSDGRVITLPPIEAPATRASKRRAQGSGTGTATPTITPVRPSPSSVATGSAEVIPSLAAVDTPKISRRQSVKSASTPSSSRPATPATVDVGPSSEDQGDLVMDESAKIKRSAKVRQSVDNNSRLKRVSSSNVAVAIEAAAQDDDYESDESWNSEDDPDRLWCICRQPHNNRFMICCDSCEDWFHGKCVNITKAMGQQMEQDGIEWTCPNCLKKKQDRQQPKLMTFWQKGKDAPTAATAEAPSAPGKTAAVPQGGIGVASNCVVCSKPSKPNSIYCSDDCIRNHASSTVANSQPSVPKNDKPKERSTASASPAPASAGVSDTSNDAQMIIVMERKTGRCLTGKNAPSIENLKGWLQAHPTFELVPPGSVQASIILAKQAEVRKQQLAKEAAEKKSTSAPITTAATSSSGPSNQSPKIQTQLKFNEQKKMVISTPTSAVVSQTSAKPQLSPKVLTTTSKQAPQKVVSSASSPVLIAKGSVTPSVRPVSSSGPQLKTNVQPTTPISSTTASSSKQRKSSHAPSPTTSSVTPADQTKHSRGSKTATTAGGENIRVTVKKTLKEHLMQRTAELQEDSTIKRLTEEEIDRFVSDTEHQMFLLFNKDTGMKYRAKYRSLVFNIKDRKNLSLFQKISEKSIEPKQLVRMTADELASQELAQWREKEAKHQLEMIKKSELDLLACAKNYVLKTHKGEEVIEGKTDDRVQLDPSAPLEDVVQLLNNSAVSSTSELDESSSSFLEGSYRSKDYDYGGVYGKSYAGIYGSGPISSSSSSVTALSGGKMENFAAAGGSMSSSSSRKKESRSRGSRSRSRSHGRKHERDRSRDRSRSKHKRKRSRDRSHDRDRDKGDREKERDRDRDRERDRERHHKGRERSRERSKHERKSSREKETSSRSTSEKRRSSTASRGTDAMVDPSAVKGGSVESERKESKSNEAQSKTATGASKKREDTISKDGASSKSTLELDQAEQKQPIKSEEGDSVRPEVVDSEKKTDDGKLSAVVSAESTSKESKADQDQEPTSTVTIPTPPHYPYEGEAPEATASGGGIISDQTLEAEKNHWTGSVHMIDVASIEMSIRAVSGEIHDVAKDFTEDLNICGTIKPEIVWEYIGQIKKSPNKEVCLVRFHSPEASAYYTLYNHLHSRKRYSVVKSPSSSIKDFYIFPLPADQMIPMILKPLRGVGIIEGDGKPNLLLGILVKIKAGKRPASSTAPSATATAVKLARSQPRTAINTAIGGKPSQQSTSNTASLMQQVITKYASKQTHPTASTSREPTIDVGVVPSKSAVPDGSLNMDPIVARSETTGAEGAHLATPDAPPNDPMDLEVDMDIIKAPIAGKASSIVSAEGNSNSSVSGASSRVPPESNAMLIDDDDDEPYSPGGGSDDSNFADVTAIVDTSKVPRGSTGVSDIALDPDEERMRIAMEELNRKIAEQKNEIMGLITTADLKEDEINSALPPSLINEIPIPPNLSQILASIKGGGGSGGGITGGTAPVGSISEVVSGMVPSSSGLLGSEPLSSVVDRATDVNADEEEYNPTTPSLYCAYKAAAAPAMPYSAIPVANSQGDIDERILPATLLPTVTPAPPTVAFDPIDSVVASEAVLGTNLVPGTLPSAASVCTPDIASSSEGESRLAKLSEEELLSMVPDDAILPDSSSKDS
uniref:PHD finger protein 3 n=1 Tax=Anopheles dirus TaxID=7168 RepID=A0A182NNL0_9DIPT